VIVVQEIFGVNDHIRDIACRLAKAGFIGLAVNYFAREGKPPSTEGGFGPVMEFVAKIPDSQVLSDTRAAVAYLRQRPDSNGKVGIVGFCWGGRVVMLAAAEVEHLDAAVAYYGRIRAREKTANQPHAPIELVAQMKTPLLGHFGALDRGIPVTDVEALREELKKYGKTAEIHIYEGANHAFNNDTRESYHPEAAQLAWKRTREWFDRYLKG
jgi:carboxymethylenebutenolidase